MTSYFVSILSLTLILLSVLLQKTSATEVELDPGKPNVCSYDTYKTGFTHTVVNYDCYKPDAVAPPCPSGYWQFPSGYHHFQRHPWRMRFPYNTLMTDKCYCIKKNTCTEDVILVKRRVVKKYYCCRGTEPDGAGGCQPTRSPLCAIDNGGCDHICKSNHTSRVCLCRPGYRLVGETQCVDINECANNNGGCNHRCNNIPGGYYCTCESGYELDFDQRTCKDINECMTGNGGCEHNCTNINGSYYCTCDIGFKLKEGHRCEDDDECSDPIVENGGCSHTCNNVYGDYYCSCPDGYVLDERGFNCEPVPGGAGFVGGEEPLTASSSKSNQYVIIYVILAVLVVAIAMVLLALFCIRRRLKNKQPLSIFIVGKKEDVEVKVEKKVKEGETSSGNVYTVQAAGGDAYTPPAPSDNVYMDPPAYDEVVDNKILDMEDPYEECCPPEVKDEKGDVKPEKNVYVNVAFKSDENHKTEC